MGPLAYIQISLYSLHVETLASSVLARILHHGVVWMFLGHETTPCLIVDIAPDSPMSGSSHVGKYGAHVGHFGSTGGHKKGSDGALRVLDWLTPASFHWK